MPAQSAVLSSAGQLQVSQAEVPVYEVQVTYEANPTFDSTLKGLPEPVNKEPATRLFKNRTIINKPQ
jgi:hypothetical protein